MDKSDRPDWCLCPESDAVQVLYGESDQPTAVVDHDLCLVWSNKAALLRFPDFRLPDGIKMLLASEDAQRILKCLKSGNSVSNIHLPLCSTNLFFQPLGSSKKLPFSLVFFETASVSGNVEKVISGFSGPFRGPVTDIFNHISILSRKKSFKHVPPDEQSHIRSIHWDTYKLLRHCLNVSEYVRFNSGNNPINLQKIEISSELRRMLQAATGQFRSREVGLTWNLSYSVYCICDIEKLECVIGNLLSNAIRFTGKQKNVVSVTLEKGYKNASITISDHGVGISSEILPHIFEPFFSYLPEGVLYRDIYPGCGLGLTLAESCVKMQGGTMVIRSTQGEGTTVVLTLPLASSESISTFASSSVDSYDVFSKIYTLLSDTCESPWPPK